MSIEKLHTYALIFLGLGFVAGFVTASFYGGEVEPALKVWALVVSVYLPFYVLRSEIREKIHIPGQFGGYDFYKTKSFKVFRTVQCVYLVLSVSIFVKVLLSYI